METITVEVSGTVREACKNWAQYCRIGAQMMPAYSRVSRGELTTIFSTLAAAVDPINIPAWWIVEITHISLENDDEPAVAKDAAVVGAWVESVIGKYADEVLRAAEIIARQRLSHS